MKNLTDSFCRKKDLEAGRYAAGHGFSFLVRPNGRYFQYRFRIDGKSREMGLGKFPDVDLATARRRHAEARSKVLSGIDPLAPETAGQSITFQQAYDEYVERKLNEMRQGVLGKKKKKVWTSAKHAAQWQKQMENHGVLDKLGGRQVIDITEDDIAEVLKPIWFTKQETARKIRNNIEAVFRTSVRRYKIANPATLDAMDELLGDNGAEAKPHKSVGRDRLPEFMAELKTRVALSARCLELTILTGCRTAESIGAKWEEFDLDNAIWTVPPERMKNGKEHTKPLSTYTVELLRSIPPMGAYVFGTKPLSNMAMLTLIKRMGYDFTSHGMRHAFKNWSVATKQDQFLSELCLAHAPKKVSAVEGDYVTEQFTEERRSIMQDWSDYVLSESV